MTSSTPREAGVIRGGVRFSRSRRGGYIVPPDDLPPAPAELTRHTMPLAVDRSSGMAAPAASPLERWGFRPTRSAREGWARLRRRAHRRRGICRCRPDRTAARSRIRWPARPRTRRSTPRGGLSRMLLGGRCPAAVSTLQARHLALSPTSRKGSSAFELISAEAPTQSAGAFSAAFSFCRRAPTRSACARRSPSRRMRSRSRSRSSTMRWPRHGATRGSRTWPSPLATP